MNGSRRMTHPPASRLLTALEGGVLVVAALYFGQPILLPLAMAILLTFLLRPCVVWLERHKIPRAAAVLVVTLTILLVIGSAGWIMTRQFRDLALHLDEYRGHLGAKAEVFQRTRLKSFENLRAVFREVAEAVDAGHHSDPSQSPAAGDGRPPDRDGPSASHDLQNRAEQAGRDDIRPHASEPQPVKLVSDSLSPVAVVKVLWDSLSTPLTTILVVSVLVFFALTEYEELRNRIYRLAGQSRLSLTTRTLDEAGKRISRYLVAYALVNGGFGLLVALGLWLLGVHYAVLWGFLAAAFRFFPYVGAIAAAGLPLCMAVIQFPDWTHPALVAGLIIALEVVTNSFVEPLTYGRSAGVSTVALLVAATFWAWIWGPLGLLLSVPMTVALTVIGKHVPQFEALGILFGDEPALAPHVSFYQRLLAGDIDEAAALLEEQLAVRGRVAAYDELIVPALALAATDRRHGDLDFTDCDIVWRNAAGLVEESFTADPPLSHRPVCVAGFAAEDPADEVALAMLQQIGAPEFEMIIVGADVMASEKIATISASDCRAVVI
ncbi:MAG: AI-2E family transporter, partial [Deltaproteobacteria bacterium]